LLQFSHVRPVCVWSQVIRVQSFQSILIVTKCHHVIQAD
jgi:hypothetical protein